MPRIRFENSYGRLPDVFYSRDKPKGAPAPNLICVNDQLCAELGLDADWLRSEDGLAMLSGNGFPGSADPLAMAYAGHQFGGFSGQLGDGRALLIGELLDPRGERFDVQLKGSGRTRFSRSGDGKATVETVLREYLVSEGMAALGIPTTRALAAVTSGEMIWREQGQLPGAILCRVAQSHVRVGTFEFSAAQHDTESVRTLADYVLQRHFPEIEGEGYEALLGAIVEKQAALVAQWMHLGFIHGVMNTDNMQVAGETLDYGPCAFMDHFDPGQVFSVVDAGGRYAWDQQAAMAHWNLIRLVEALAPILTDSRDALQEVAERVGASFSRRFEHDFLQGFRRKLGFLGAQDGDLPFIQNTFEVMAKDSVDFTLFFRHLTRLAGDQGQAEFESLFSSVDNARLWLKSWQARIAQDSASDLERAATMGRINPIFIPRNHRVEEAIQDGFAGDFSSFRRLNQILARPFEEQPEYEAYERAPSDAERVRQTHCNT